MFIAGRHANILKPQRGDMFIAGRHVPFVSITNYTEGGKGEGESPLVYLAPEGRHVYSRATCALCLNHELDGLSEWHGGGSVCI